jgi:heat shock protein HtpX
MAGTIKTTLLLAGLTGLFVVVGNVLGGQTGMIFAFVLAIAMNMGAWWFSDKIALKMNGAQEVTPAEAPDLHRMIDTLATRANLPKPRVYVINTSMPNAFATGRSPNHAAVAATTGIMQMLSYDELSGVMAHELAHIKNRDTLISSIAATIAGAVTMLAEIAQWGLIFGFAGGNDEEGGGNIFTMLLLIILAPIAATIIQLAISRAREFSADAEGARILGDPLPLASALEQLERGVSKQPAQVNPSSAHLYIVNPLRAQGLMNLFRTHPPTEERISRLRSMSGRTALAS